jgi:hypothetical protein
VYLSGPFTNQHLYPKLLFSICLHFSPCCFCKALQFIPSTLALAHRTTFTKLTVHKQAECYDESSYEYVCGTSTAKEKVMKTRANLLANEQGVKINNQLLQ